MCNIEKPGDVCDCIMQAIEIAREGDRKLDVAYLNETIYRTVQIARDNAAREERNRIKAELTNLLDQA